MTYKGQIKNGVAVLDTPCPLPEGTPVLVELDSPSSFWTISCPLFARLKNSGEHNVMWDDPIVAEVHQARERVAAECNFDITAFFADLRRRQATLGGRLVMQKKQSGPTVEAGRGGDSGSPNSKSSEAAPAAER